MGELLRPLASIADYFRRKCDHEEEFGKRWRSGLRAGLSRRAPLGGFPHPVAAATVLSQWEKASDGWENDFDRLTLFCGCYW